MTTPLLVAMFGAVGVISRYMIDLKVQRWAVADFPISTFAALKANYYQKNWQRH